MEDRASFYVESSLPAVQHIYPQILQTCYSWFLILGFEGYSGKTKSGPNFVTNESEVTCRDPLTYGFFFNKMWLNIYISEFLALP